MICFALELETEAVFDDLENLQIYSLPDLITKLFHQFYFLRSSIKS
jgi:hypothetical protein